MFDCRDFQGLDAGSGQEMLTRRSSQKARAAELNAARARRAAQMQSIDDEIPDLSGPVSLGTLKFTRRGRGKKYETHKLSELQAIQENEDENKVTESVPTSSTHPLLTLPPPTTLSSFPLPGRPSHQSEVEINDSVLNRSDKTSLEKRGFHDAGPRRYHELDQSHPAANLSNPIRSFYTDRAISQASCQASSSFPTGQDHRSSQDSSALIKPDTSNSQASGQFHSSLTPDSHSSNQDFTPTIKPYRQSSQPASTQADHSFSHQDHSSDQNLTISIDTNRRSSQASRQAPPSLPPPDRRLDTSHLYNELAKTLQALTKTDKRSSKASEQVDSPFPPQVFRRHTSHLYGKTNSEVNDLPAANRQSPQASSRAHHPASPKDFSSTQSLSLADILRSATFNPTSNQWDPDLAAANMHHLTPTEKSTRGGHTAQHSSRQSSSGMSRNPNAIVTTTKAGRPYTNPYMPIDPPPSTARQIVRESPSGHISQNTQYDDPEMVQRQHQIRYIDQEEARYRALEETGYEHAEETLDDDPFQDQPTHVQHYGRNQPANYAEHAAQRATYGQLPDYGHQPTHATYASNSGAQPASHGPSTGMTPYRGQHSSYEQQAVANQSAQNPGAALHEQHSAYEQQRATNLRAPVRLPAVRGTTDQQNPFPPKPEFEGLSLEDSTDRNTQDQRRRHTHGGVPPASGRASHAVPIRDPAAYTGSGLTTRRNQDALRQNLDTVVASSQGPTGSARTVMNDPHRDRQPSGRPSPTVTDTTVTGSTLRAQAPSYEMNPRSTTSHRQGIAAVGDGKPQPLQHNTGNTLNRPDRAIADTEIMDIRESFRAPAIPPGFGLDTAAYTKNAGLPAAAIGAGNVFMNNLVRKVPPKRNPQQQLEDAAAWFRADPRDLSYAAAILPHETMNRMNPDLFPLQDTTPRSVSQLADDSQDDDPSDRARQAATPRPIGHGRPAGSTTPPDNHGPSQAEIQAPFSTLAGVTSVNDTEGMARAGREFLAEDARAIEAMFGGVYTNLMTASNGPYDYLSHYAPPPAYAIDHNPQNNHTLFDPQWFATAPPARVGRDPRREQGEYEDPTQGSASRRGDHARGDVRGRGGSGGRAWGRN